jgi:hypothetical protein
MASDLGHLFAEISSYIAAISSLSTLVSSLVSAALVSTTVNLHKSTLEFEGLGWKYFTAKALYDSQTLEERLSYAHSHWSLSRVLFIVSFGLFFSILLSLLFNQESPLPYTNLLALPLILLGLLESVSIGYLWRHLDESLDEYILATSLSGGISTLLRTQLTNVIVVLVVIRLAGLLWIWRPFQRKSKKIQ